MKFISEEILKYHNNREHGTSKLSKHKSKVKAEKKERCEHCPQAFRHYNSLRKHSLVTHNIRIRWKKAVSAYCKLCLKTFTEVGGYRSHVKAVHISPEESAALQMEKIDSASLVF